MQGIDLPGSVVEIGLKRQSGQTEIVTLRRIANAVIADKRALFELFTKCIDRAKKDNDRAQEQYLQQALELWTQEMLEQYEHDTICMNNVHDMQKSADAWLQELLDVLEGEVSMQKQAPKAQPSPSLSPPPISQEDLDLLRALLAERDAEVQDLKRKLQSATDLAKTLKRKVDEDKAVLDQDQKDLSDRDLRIKQLEEQLSKTIYVKDNEIDAKDSDLAARSAEIDALKKKLAALERDFEKDEIELKADRKQLREDEKQLSDKDAEIDELKRKLAALQKSLDGINSNSENELNSLRARLQAIQVELQKATDALNRTEESMQAMAAENEEFKKKIAVLQKEQETDRTKIGKYETDLAQKDAEIEDLKKKLAKLMKDLQDAKDEMDDSASMQAELKTKISKCRDLIALSQKRVAEDHLAQHTILTTTGLDATTVGLMFEEKSGSIIIDYILVGGPAFISKQIEKGDVITAIDGKVHKGDAIYQALQGEANSSVTLSVMKGGVGPVKNVVLHRMLTALIADKRKMFDLFTRIEGRFNKMKDADGIKRTEEALKLWTDMMVEEQDQDDKCLANVTAMQADTDRWLTECDVILAGIIHESPVSKLQHTTHMVSGAGANGQVSPRLAGPQVSTAGTGSNTQVAVLNQALKKMEESLKKETERRKAVESEVQFLKALDKKLAQASEEFNSNKDADKAPAVSTQREGGYVLTFCAW